MHFLLPVGAPSTSGVVLGRVGLVGCVCLGSYLKLTCTLWFLGRSAGCGTGNPLSCSPWAPVSAIAFLVFGQAGMNEEELRMGTGWGWIRWMCLLLAARRVVPKPAVTRSSEGLLLCLVAADLAGPSLKILIQSS